MTSDNRIEPGQPARMPVFFIPHGAGPCFFMDWNPADTWNRMAAFLKGVSATLPARPKAIVLVSGHWLEPGFNVTGSARPPLIYDYSGFPPHTYELAYPAPGSPALAEQVAGLLGQDGAAARVDGERGFDHGVFIPLKLMFPAADIPVVQLSLRADLDPGAHLQAGRALAQCATKECDIGAAEIPPTCAARRCALHAGLSRIRRMMNADGNRACGTRALLADWTPPHAGVPSTGARKTASVLVAAGAAADSEGRKVYSETVMATTISAFRFG